MHRALAALAALACGSDPPAATGLGGTGGSGGGAVCVPGQEVVRPCPGGDGTLLCLPDGSAFGACDCTGGGGGMGGGVGHGGMPGSGGAGASAGVGGSGGEGGGCAPGAADCDGDAANGCVATPAPGGHVCVQIGNSVIRGEAVDNAALLRRVAPRVGFAEVAAMSRAIPLHRKAFNLHHARICRENILVFRLES